MQSCAFMFFSRSLKGRTRTATLTDDILPVRSSKGTLSHKLLGGDVADAGYVPALLTASKLSTGSTRRKHVVVQDRQASPASLR